MYEWRRKLKILCLVTDTIRSDQACTIIMPQATAEVECIIQENHHVKVNDVVAMLNISHGSAHHTAHDVLQFHHVSVRWVHRQLTPVLEE
jgi:hypothetical protein